MPGQLAGRKGEGWRAMAADDIPAVKRISDAVHGRYTEDAAIYAERLERFALGCRIWMMDDSMAGYLVSHPWHHHLPPPLGQAIGPIPAGADTFYLHDLALIPAARGLGAGRAALEWVIARAREGGFADVTLTAVNGADRYWLARGFSYASEEAIHSYNEGF